MKTGQSKQWSSLSPMNPDSGTVIRSPMGQEKGYWVGAPGVYFDSSDATFYLTYRIRRPRGVEPDRGGEIRIARSSDGVAFDDIWTGTKDKLNTPSIERCALIRDDDGKWLFYVSYVDPEDQRWRTDVVEADSPDRFDLTQTCPVLTAKSIGAEGVKDPFVFRLAGLYHMILSYAFVEGDADNQALHGTADAYNTGLIHSATGLATSENGRDWQWHGPLLLPAKGKWDAYCARIGCLWYQAPVWLALYDGSADVSENYEERCGLAYSCDLRTFHRVSRSGPLWQNPHASGALRYFDVLDFPNERFLYYEMARPDGSHDLRVLRRSK